MLNPQATNTCFFFPQISQKPGNLPIWSGQRPTKLLLHFLGLGVLQLSLWLGMVQPGGLGVAFCGGRSPRVQTRQRWEFGLAPMEGRRLHLPRCFFYMFFASKWFLFQNPVGNSVKVKHKKIKWISESLLESWIFTGKVISSIEINKGFIAKMFWETARRLPQNLSSIQLVLSCLTRVG